MTRLHAVIVPLAARQEQRVAYEFDGIGCGYRVYAAVHFGHRRLCMTCQELGPAMSGCLRDRAGNDAVAVAVGKRAGIRAEGSPASAPAPDVASEVAS